jgi:hypothetical protein
LPFSFTETELQAIRNCIHDITLPTWIQRPLINLGEPSHGKLKAQEYLTQFTCIFPLIIPEFLYMATATNFHQQHFYCFYHVVAATNIVAAYQTSNADADAYTQHYIQYQTAIQQLFHIVHPSQTIIMQCIMVFFSNIGVFWHHLVSFQVNT